MKIESPTNNNDDKRALESVNAAYRFDDYYFAATQLELYKNDELIPLSLQPARLLKILIENAPETVARRLLQERIWDTGTIVEFDQGLNACVNQLRTALGDSASAPKYIETLPKRGYRFIQPIKVEQQNQSKALRWPLIGFLMGILLLAGIWFLMAETSSPVSPRIYVAPVQIEGEGLSDYAGIAQFALRLGTIERLGSGGLETMQTLSGVSLWQDIDQQQNSNLYDYSLFMTLSQVAESYRIEASMACSQACDGLEQKTFHAANLDASSLQQLSNDIVDWAGGLFDVSMQAGDQVFTVQDPAYFEAMIRAQRAFMVADSQSLQISLTWYENALALNPGSVDAQGGKAIVLAVLAGTAGFPATQTYAKAVQLSDSIREVYGPSVKSELTSGYIYLYRDWNLDKARQSFDLALELAPSDSLVHAWRAAVLAAQHDVQAAALSAEQAVRIDPLSMSINSDRCWYLGAAKRYDEAVDACQWVLDIEPNSFSSRMSLIAALEKLDREQEALATLQPLWLALNNGVVDTPIFDQEKRTPLQATQCAVADVMSERASQVQIPLVALAALNAQCGRYENVPDLLTSAQRRGESGLLFYAVDPRFETFRNHPLANSIDVRIKPR